MPIFKVMTWNVENLFRPDRKAEAGELANYTQKLNSLAKVILELDPDVLAIQEVGGVEPFKDLADNLQNRYPYSQLSNQPDKRGIRVGFLSKLLIEESEDIVDFPQAGISKIPSIDREGNFVDVTRLARGALRILVKPTLDSSIHLIVAHLKSKLLTFPSQSGKSRFIPNDEDERARIAGIALLQRTAEVITLRVKVNELLKRKPDNAVIVLGDLNDVTNAATTQILQGPPGSEIGTSGFNRPDAGDEARLFNLAPLIDPKRRYSRIFKGNGELIDHILVSEELLPGLPRQTPKVDSHVDAVGSIPSVSDDPNERRGRPGSDHAPITAHFNL